MSTVRAQEQLGTQSRHILETSARRLAAAIWESDADDPVDDADVQAAGDLLWFMSYRWAPEGERSRATLFAGEYFGNPVIDEAARMGAELMAGEAPSLGRRVAAVATQLRAARAVKDAEPIGVVMPGARTFALELYRLAELCRVHDWTPLGRHELPDSAWREVAELFGKAAAFILRPGDAAPAEPFPDMEVDIERAENRLVHSNWTRELAKSMWQKARHARADRAGATKLLEVELYDVGDALWKLANNGDVTDGRSESERDAARESLRVAFEHSDDPGGEGLKVGQAILDDFPDFRLPEVRDRVGVLLMNLGVKLQTAQAELQLIPDVKHWCPDRSCGRVWIGRVGPPRRCTCGAQMVQDSPAPASAPRGKAADAPAPALATAAFAEAGAAVNLPWEHDVARAERVRLAKALRAYSVEECDPDWKNALVWASGYISAHTGDVDDGSGQIRDAELVGAGARAAELRTPFAFIRPGGTATAARSGHLVCPDFQIPGPYEWVRVETILGAQAKQGIHFLVFAQVNNQMLRCNCGRSFYRDEAQIIQVD